MRTPGLLAFSSVFGAISWNGTNLRLLTRIAGYASNRLLGGSSRRLGHRCGGRWRGFRYGTPHAPEATVAEREGVLM